MQWYLKRRGIVSQIAEEAKIHFPEQNRKERRRKAKMFLKQLKES